MDATKTLLDVVPVSGSCALNTILSVTVSVAVDYQTLNTCQLGTVGSLSSIQVAPILFETRWSHSTLHGIWQP